MKRIDEEILKLLKSCNEGMTFAGIKKALGIKELNDKALTLSLRRLVKYKFIRKILYYDFQKPKLLYVPVTGNDRYERVLIWVRTEVLLDEKIPCYYDVFLDWAGDRVNHDLTFK